MENPVPEHTFFSQNPVPEHDFCSGVMGGKLTKLQHTAYTSKAQTCLINTRIYKSCVFAAANSLTTVETEKFSTIQEFPYVRYKVLAGLVTLV